MTAGTKWATTTGGAGGAAVPSAADDVFFDANSGSTTCTITANAAAKSIDCTGYTGGLTHNSGVSISIGGFGAAGQGNIALKFVAGMTYTRGSATTSSISFVTTSVGTAQTITFAGQYPGDLTFNGTSASWQLQDTFSNSSSTWTLSAGTLDVNGKTVSISVFNSNVSVARTLTLGAAAITLNGGGSGGHAILINGTNLTVTANTATFTISASGADVNVQSSVNFNGASVTFTGANTATALIQGVSVTQTWANVTFTGTAAQTNIFPIQAALTVTGTLTVTGNSRINQVLMQSSTAGTQATVTVNGTVAITNTDIQDINAAGSASWNLSSQTDVGDAQGNTGITFPATVTNYWKHTTASWQNVNNWASTSGGTGGTGRIPLPQDNVVFDANSAIPNSTAITLNMVRLGKNIDASAWNPTGGSLSNGLVTQYIFGNLTLRNTMATWGGGSSSLVFAGRGSQTITTAGVTLGNTTGWQTRIDCVTGTYTLQDAATLAGQLNLTSGTIDTNGMTVTCDSVVSGGSSTRTLTLGASVINLTSVTASSQPWNMSGSNNTVNAGSSEIVFSTATANSRSFTGNGFTYGKLTYTVAASTGFLTVSAGNHTFNDGIYVGSGRAIFFVAGTTNTFNNWSVNGVRNGYVETAATVSSGTGGNTISTPDSIPLSITGDIDVRVRMSAPDWSPASSSNVLCKILTTGNNYSYYLNYQSTGSLLFQWSTDGTLGALLGTQSTANLSALNAYDIRWVRATLDVNDGAGNRVQKYYTATVEDPGPSDWTQLGTTITTAGTTSIFDGTGALELGAYDAGAQGLSSGIRYYRAQIRNNILDDGTGIVFDADFTKKPVGSNFVTDTANNALVSILGAVNQAGDGRVTVTCTSAAQHTLNKLGAPATSSYAVIAYSNNSSKTLRALSSVNYSLNSGWIFSEAGIPGANMSVNGGVLTRAASFKPGRAR